ncbi:hypothetical protein [Paenibacillus roseipurpureus]|uniref:Uncharacterized protein n=1 Tax=Paenibacillus roseopurpureus TaxID=2918901 RepID=A0AA96LMK3_9BACL|nr:hypothetical protein [Paenibacillus sp. MBLB1832]WNR43872.1 hypothetical protein MJB10_22685 [Paenibacillus sp. MBLB1832]
MAEMTDREFLSAMLGRINEIGADVTAIKDRVENMDRRLSRVEDRLDSMDIRLNAVNTSLQEVKQVQIQQGEQIAGIAVTMMEHAASIRTLKLAK